MADRAEQGGRGLLGRWSERKQAAIKEARERRGGAAPVLPEEAPEAALPELYDGDERPLTEEEEAVVAALPDIDSLHAESDFTPFMQSNVPEFLRRRALKALWRTSPVLANVDGLVDYGEDYTDAARVVEGLQTAYRVGKGFLTDEEHAAREKTDATAQESVAETEAEDAPVEEVAPGETDAAAEDEDAVRQTVHVAMENAPESATEGRDPE